MPRSAQELKDLYAGTVFDEIKLTASPDELLEFALACGETDPRYIDPDHPDYQAPVNFTTKYTGGRMLPVDFPRFDRAAMIDAGKAVTRHAPIRSGDELTGSSLLHDIYEKTGRSGLMLFLVHRMEFRNQDGQLATVVDWRLILRGGIE